MQKYTSLVNVKWTKSSMLKVHEMMFDKYIDEMIYQNKFSNDETGKRMFTMSEWIYHILKLCNKNDIAFKKKKK